jgi:phage gp36-like protein
MYASQADIVKLHGADFLLVIAERGDERSLADTRTQTAIAEALAHAGAEINSYLAARYPVPVTPVPFNLKNHCINVACYILASTSDRMTDIIRERYKNAHDWLKDIAAGRANLPPAVDPNAGGPGGQQMNQPAPEHAEFDMSEPRFQRGSY